MVISRYSKMFSEEPKTNFEKIRKMSEDEVANMLMDFATIGVPKDKQTEEFKSEVELTIRAYLKQKPKSKLEMLKDAMAEARSAISAADNETATISVESLKMLMECGDIIQSEQNTF